MTRLASKVPVEALSPERVAGVERRVMAAFTGVDLEPTRRRRWARWAVPMVAAAGVGLAIFLNLQATTGPLISPVAVHDARTAHVRTGADGGTEISVGDAKVKLAPDSEAHIDEQIGGGTLITLRAGSVRCVVAPRQGRAPFVVLAGDVKVVVVGTIFSVQMGEPVRVQVERGKVRVERGDTVDMVAAGERWRSDTRLARVGDAPAPAASKTAVTRGDTGKHVALSRRRSHVPGSKSSKPRSKRSASSKTKTTPKAASNPFSRLRGARRLAAPLAVTATSARQRISMYRAIRSGARAEHAMYSIAYVQLKVLGQRASAARSTSNYRTRYSSGKHARDVAWLRMEALCGGGPSRSCRSAAHAYRSRYSGNARELQVVQSLIDWVP